MSQAGLHPVLQMPSTLPPNTMIYRGATSSHQLLEALGWDKQEDAAMLRRQSMAQAVRAFGF